MKRCDPEGAVGRRQSGIQRLKASATSGPMVAALTRQTVYWDHLLSTLELIVAGGLPRHQAAYLPRTRKRTGCTWSGPGRISISFCERTTLDAMGSDS